MKQQNHASALITARALSERLSDPNVKIIDATYGQPALPLGIGQAINFDIDAIADLRAPLPHTVPNPADFEAAVSRLGVSDTDNIVIYDQTGCAFAAARVWWMFRLFGHDKVKVLDGGLPAWHAEGLPFHAKAPAEKAGQFRARFQSHLLARQSDIEDTLSTQACSILDARDPLRFSGQQKDPRPGVASGHIPGSLNIFYHDLIDPDTAMLKSRDDCAALFKQSCIDLDRPVICTCGSGVTACVVALALYETHGIDAAIYDGSWAEWATSGCPVALS